MDRSLDSLIDHLLEEVAHRSVVGGFLNKGVVVNIDGVYLELGWGGLDSGSQIDDK